MAKKTHKLRSEYIKKARKIQMQQAIHVKTIQKLKKRLEH